MSLNRRVSVPADRFTIISNDWVRDADLSWKARGILAYLMSHRIGWSVTLDSLARAGIDGKDSVRSGVKELVDAGYLQVSRQRNDDGTLGGVDYDLVDPVRAAGEPDADNPTQADPEQADPSLVDPLTKKTSSLEDHSSQKTIKKPSAPRREPKTRMPEGWKPSADLFTYAKENGLDPFMELESFKAWTSAGDYRYARWDMAFRQHLIKSIERLASTGRRGYGQKPSIRETAQQMAEAAAALQARFDAQGGPQQLQIGS